jgi:ACT domain-containing protein
MKITEDLVRKITLDAINEVGNNASPEIVKEIVSKAIEDIQNSGNDSITLPEKNPFSSSNRIILTAYGLNKPGIIFRITQILADFSCDIQDLSQKLLQEYFTVIMIVDLSNATISFNMLREKLQKLGDELNMRVILQHEEVFQYMHRI